MKTVIFTDGACSGNPGPGGWAAVLVFKDKTHQIISGGEVYTTNNRMELSGVIEGLKLAISLGCDNVEVRSDSAYVVNAIKLGWMKKWSLNGWKTIRETDVQNKDLLVKLQHLIKRVPKIKFVKVKGHSGIKFNELADEMAKKELERVKVEIGGY